MEIESLKELATKYYPLAYTLLPEELMASQLLIDTCSALLLSQESEVTFNRESQFEADFVRMMVDLAVVRNKHFSHREPGIFFRLELEERVFVFLRDRMDFSPHQISVMLKKNMQDVLQVLHQGRTKMVQGLGENAEGIF